MSEIDPNENLTPNDLSPWRSMWTQPRATMRFLLQQTPHWRWWLPAYLLGCAAVFQMTTLHPELNKAALSQRILTSMMLGPIPAWFEVVFVAFGLRIIGLLWQGQASTRALRLAVCWAQLPNLIAFALWWLEWQWLGLPLVEQDFSAAQWLLQILRASLSLYGALLLAMAVAEVQQISLRRGVIGVALLFLVFMLLLSGLNVSAPVG